jgi:hypothetical protein
MFVVGPASSRPVLDNAVRGRHVDPGLPHLKDMTARAFRNLETNATTVPTFENAEGNIGRSRLGVFFPPPLLARIAEASGGNPLFALGIAHATTRGKRASLDDPLSVPVGWTN